MQPLGPGNSEPVFVDLWLNDAPAYKFAPKLDCSVANQASGCVYLDDLFKNEAVSYIQDHKKKRSDQPLFLVFAPHAIHSPLSPPNAWSTEF